MARSDFSRKNCESRCGGEGGGEVTVIAYSNVKQASGEVRVKID